ncbi:hypothetical protein ScPMuIL_016522 [Solemya velum]
MALPPLQLKEDVRDHLQTSFINDQTVSELGKHKCEEEFLRLLDQLGSPPLFTTLRVNIHNSDCEHIIPLLQEEINKQCDKRGICHFDILKHHSLKDVVVIKNRGPNLNLEQSEKEVIVDLACGMAVLRGADVFVQGIMAAHPGMNENTLVSVFADVEGACRKGFVKQFTGRKIFIGNGVAKFSRDKIFTVNGMRGVGISMTHPLYEAPCLSDILPELVFPQNLPSAVCVHVLDPQPGELVLDMCAAPGGKTQHIATLMRNEGRIVALDKVKQKVKRVEANVQVWGMTCVECYAFDATEACRDGAGGSPPYPAGMFDRVLLDAPCSALGQRPSSFCKMTLPSLRSFETYQWKFFTQAVRLLKPGGTLVYSTCTITMAENEGCVAHALKTFPNLELCPQIPHVGGPGRLCPGLTADQLAKLQRFSPAREEGTDPTVDNDTIGFFIAKFKKKS